MAAEMGGGEEHRVAEGAAGGRETAEMGGRLREQLAAVVRSIGWTYAIYWSRDRSDRRGRSAVLEWRDGYYNGDVRATRPRGDGDLRPDRRGLRRTAQLRELYQSLAGGGPSSAASPEDLTHSEWYFLLCMSFTFANGQGLPGRTLSCGSEIWLCNAQFADSCVFSRALLAKSASIQTIVCAPFMDGVLELGTTGRVFENQDLIKHSTSPFSDRPMTARSGPSVSSSRRVEEEEEGQVAPPPVDIAEDTPCATLRSDEGRLEEPESRKVRLTGERIDRKGGRDHATSETISKSTGVAGEAAVERQCAVIPSKPHGRCRSSAHVVASVLAGGKEVVVEMCCPWREFRPLETPTPCNPPPSMAASASPSIPS